jgi:hypothetical protein
MHIYTYTYACISTFMALYGGILAWSRWRQGIYVWDALYAEKCILTTMDITTDGFG